jgi:hypothetical protein
VSEPASALPAQPHDLAGTLTLTSTALQVNALAPFTLTLRNVSDHSVSIVDYPQGIQALAIHVKTPTVGGFSSTVVADVSVLAPGEQHDFTGSGGVSDPFMIGPARLGADLIVKTGVWPDERFEYRSLAAVSQIAVDIVPPGWTAGPPLDPSLGEWSVRMSADATEVHAGDVVRMRAVVRNAGDLPQTTEGYGSLAIVCSNGTTVFGRFIDSTTLQPGAEQTFSTLVQSPEWLVGRYDCSLGLGFGGNIGNARSHRGIESDSIAITVLPALEPTTTTAPELTTSTTTP